MDSLNTFAMESNKQFKINFAGGDLSSDAGLILIKEDNLFETHHIRHAL